MRIHSNANRFGILVKSLEVPITNSQKRVFDTHADRQRNRRCTNQIAVREIKVRPDAKSRSLNRINRITQCRRNNYSNGEQQNRPLKSNVERNRQYETKDQEPKSCACL